MPEIKIKHVVSFSSEDKVHKAENLIKPETYRKWKCATPGEKNAMIVLQFEKATQIHSIDIGNESSAFVEILAGRSSDSVSEYQVLLVASSFMSPLESRNGTHANRVRMFGPEKLSQNVKDEKWDCVQIICTQPFNKNITYGLTFIKFHSPPEKTEDLPKNSEAEKHTTKLGAFNLKDDDDEDSLPPIGSWFGKKKTESPSSSAANKMTPSYAAAVLASSSSSPTSSPQSNTQKRKIDETNSSSQEPPAKKTPSADLNKEHIVYKDVLRGTPENKKLSNANGDLTKKASSPKADNSNKAPVKSPVVKPTTVNQQVKLKPKPPFNKLMDGVVFVLSGFVNPLRSELREKAVEMGAKYKADWNRFCTHLVCAFLHTPKYEQVKKLGGHIVTKEWVLDCYNEKRKLPLKDYILGKVTHDSSDDEDPTYKGDESESDSEAEVIEESEEGEEDESSEEEYASKKKKKKPQTVFQRRKNRQANSPSKKNLSSTDLNASVSKAELNTPKKGESSIFGKINQSNNPDQGLISDNTHSPTMPAVNEGSETEDEDALQDYVADTDVDDDSGGNTEDEIRRVEMKIQKKKAKNSKVNGSKEDSESTVKPNVTDLPLPELPNIFKQKRFFLYGVFSPAKLHDMQRFIIAYNGVIEDYMNEKVKYVITDEKWDKNFEDALSANEDLIFVKPTWIYKCHDAGKLVPYQPHIIIPDS